MDWLHLWRRNGSRRLASGKSWVPRPGESCVPFFVREFMVLIGIAYLIAAPLAGWYMYSWLQGFQNRITMSWWIFATGGLISVLIALATVASRCAARGEYESRAGIENRVVRLSHCRENNKILIERGGMRIEVIDNRRAVLRVPGHKILPTRSCKLPVGKSSAFNALTCRWKIAVLPLLRLEQFLLQGPGSGRGLLPRKASTCFVPMKGQTGGSMLSTLHNSDWLR